MKKKNRYVVILFSVALFIGMLTLSLAAINVTAANTPNAPDDSGGPDGFGYTFEDSDEPGTSCTTSFIDISATGARIDSPTSVAYTVTTPFLFNFYGVDSNRFIGQ